MDFNLLFIYFITVNKYWFCISVIGYINVQSIGIGYKKSISTVSVISIISLPTLHPVLNILVLFLIATLV